MEKSTLVSIIEKRIKERAELQQEERSVLDRIVITDPVIIESLHEDVHQKLIQQEMLFLRVDDDKKDGTYTIITSYPLYNAIVMFISGAEQKDLPREKRTITRIIIF